MPTTQPRFEVVTTDTFDPQQSGLLVNNASGAYPWIDSNTPDAGGAFIVNASVGVAGSGEVSVVFDEPGLYPYAASGRPRQTGTVAVKAETVHKLESFVFAVPDCIAVLAGL